METHDRLFKHIVFVEMHLLAPPVDIFMFSRDSCISICIDIRRGELEMRQRYKLVKGKAIFDHSLLNI